MKVTVTVDLNDALIKRIADNADISHNKEKVVEILKEFLTDLSNEKQFMIVCDNLNEYLFSELI